MYSHLIETEINQLKNRLREAYYPKTKPFVTYLNQFINNKNITTTKPYTTDHLSLKPISIRNRSALEMAFLMEDAGGKFLVLSEQFDQNDLFSVTIYRYYDEQPSENGSVFNLYATDLDCCHPQQDRSSLKKIVSSLESKNGSRLSPCVTFHQSKEKDGSDKYSFFLSLVSQIDLNDDKVLFNNLELLIDSIEETYPHYPKFDWDEAHKAILNFKSESAEQYQNRKKIESDQLGSEVNDPAFKDEVKKKFQEMIDKSK